MSEKDRPGLEGIFVEQDLPLLIRRQGMADWCDGIVRILDRRALPHDERYVDCESVEQVAVCIEDMVIQGAFSLSIAAGYGLALAANEAGTDCQARLQAAAARLKKTRPTGLALHRMLAACMVVAEEALAADESPLQAILDTVDRGAAALARQGYETGRIACELLPDNATILTHCFPDRSYAYMLVEAKRTGKTLRVIASETRPYLQGARLTSFCAQQAGFDVNVITDGMGGFLMRRGEIDAFVTAADRVCMDGTVCNKVGTYQYALAAQANELPYYVLRQSGPDVESADESSVEVEFRDGEEVVNIGGIRSAPSGVDGLYPAFDITPANLVSKIITDRGAYLAPEIASYIDAPPFVSDAVV
jgi:methylthioribose-1-phosphate isomerase